MSSQASRALSLYKTILRAGRKWPEPTEREYIHEEAERLFRANRGITNPEYVSLLILLALSH